MRAQRSIDASQVEVDRLVTWLTVVVRADDTPAWERTFAASIIRQARRPSKRGPWRPSPRQLRVMARIVERFQRDVLGDEGVIE